MTTSVFRIPPARYVRRAAGIWAARGGVLWLLPAVAAACAGFHDPRFFIVALALVCVIYPGILMIVYFSYALRPEAAFATIPHRVSLSADGIDIEYFPADETVKCPPVRHIPLDGISSAEDTGQSLVITLKSGRYDFIIIPISEFCGNFPSDFIKLVSQA